MVAGRISVAIARAIARIIQQRLADELSASQGGRRAAGRQKCYRLEYADVNGEITVRDIDLIKVVRKNRDIHLHAHCHLRDAYRTFRVDRILEAWELPSERRISDPHAAFSRMVRPALRWPIRR